MPETDTDLNELYVAGREPFLARLRPRESAFRRNPSTGRAVLSTRLPGGDISALRALPEKSTHEGVKPVLLEHASEEDAAKRIVKATLTPERAPHRHGRQP